MSELTGIKTIEKDYESKLKEKGSLFLGIAKPINNINEAESFLANIKKQYFDATHHCYAFKLFPDIIKYSDDGEPTGTAGIRLLNALNHFELTNVLLVSVRYFGGIKLGVGPLGKAYYQNGIETLENAQIVNKELYLNFRVKYAYQLTKTVHYLLNKYNCKIIKTDYFQSEQSTFYKIKFINVQNFNNELFSLTNNNIQLKDLDIKELI